MTGWCQCNQGGLLKEKGRWISISGRRLREEAERLEEEERKRPLEAGKSKETDFVFKASRKNAFLLTP